MGGEQMKVVEGEDALVVLITVASREEAERIARRLVEDRLAACVNIVSQVRSFFIWQGKFSQEDELLLVAKTRRARFRELATAVTQLHSYSVPEIIALPILVGSSDYLRWVAEST
jgi:periplasmic divalent cation tolerance protein